MLKNSFGDLYVGITASLGKRLSAHNLKRGALFTRRESKFEIVFYEGYKTMSEARKREIQIKKWRRDKKEMLIKKFSQGLPTK
jgi:putative endonuclease